MKKYISLLMALIMIFFLNAAFAAEGQELTSLSVILFTEVPDGMPKAQTLVFDLRDADTNLLLDSRSVTLGDVQAPVFRLDFDVPAYKIGKSFIFHMSQGDAVLDYNGQTGAYFVIQTYSYPDDEGVWRLYNTEFCMSLRPAAERFVNLKLAGEARADVPLQVLPQGILIPAYALESLGIKSEITEDGGFQLKAEGRSLKIYVGYTDAYSNTEALELTMAPMYLDDAVYVPVSALAEVFGCSIEHSDDGRTLNLSIGRSPYVMTAAEKLINSRNIASDTGYLVWVSKSEYLVRVFTGSAGNWYMINSFGCAIGAPSTPTIEGTFKYYQYQDRWNYDKYYCGPIMRFKGGYAIHSTLLRYDGRDYDGRTGMRISHGCVRVRPENINWLVNTVPLQTTIYVTA